MPPHLNADDENHDDAQTVRKRSVRIAGHATSVSMEQAFWDSLKDIAVKRGLSVTALITEIDQTRMGNLSSAIRVFIVQYLKTETTDKA